jgi:hypothetical protein
MEHSSGEPRYPEQDPVSLRRAVVPLTVTVWLFGSGLLWVAAMGAGSDSHHDTILETDLRTLSAQFAVVLFVLGPAVVGMFQLGFGKRIAGYSWLALTIALGALMLSSANVVGLMSL